MGTRIRDFRLKRGLTRQKLARLTGLKISTIGNLENGKIRLKARMICALVKALDCSADDLLGNIKS